MKWWPSTEPPASKLWSTKLAQIPLGGATMANDLVFTTTLMSDVIALSRKDGSIAWMSHLPAGSNATQHAVVVAYQLGAS